MSSLAIRGIGWTVGSFFCYFGRVGCGRQVKVRQFSSWAAMKDEGCLFLRRLSCGSGVGRHVRLLLLEIGDEGAYFHNGLLNCSSSRPAREEERRLHIVNFHIVKQIPTK